MAEPSTPHEAARPRVFISYSRTDRRRATGLAVLSQALGHHVFIDHRSIVGGRRWRDALEEGLQRADVLLVFWTRHAKRSTWVRWEYERFDTRFPDRPLVPVLGDRTPLPDRLQARQSSDLRPPIKPLIQELSDTVRTMKARGASMRQIRAAVLQRLEAEGITLRRDQRHRLFGLFRILPWAMVPLYVLVDQRDRLVDFLQHQGDHLVDFLQHQGARLVDETLTLAAKLSALPAPYYYTAGVAITAGFLTCHGAARGLDTIAYKKGHEAAQVEVRQQVSLLSQRLAAVDAEVEARVAQGIAEAKRQLRDTDEERLRDFYRQLAPDLFPVDVHLDQSGTDACDAQEMICVSMSRRRLFLSRNHKFYGYMTPSCSARVIREPTCVESSQTDYALKGIVEPRSPEADADVPDLSWQDYVCLQTGKGPQGIYQFANCVKP